MGTTRKIGVQNIHVNIILIIFMHDLSIYDTFSSFIVSFFKTSLSFDLFLLVQMIVVMEPRRVWLGQAADIFEQ